MWAEMWAVARYDLRLSEKEFWGLTLKKFNCLLSRYFNFIERQDFHAGLICAVLANIHRDPKTKSFTPQDFMPGKTKPEAQTPEQMLELFKSLGAKTVRKKKHG
jgi:hypothetical protein